MLRCANPIERRLLAICLVPHLAAGARPIAKVIDDGGVLIETSKLSALALDMLRVERLAKMIAG